MFRRTRFVLRRLGSQLGHGVSAIDELVNRGADAEQDASAHEVRPGGVETSGQPYKKEDDQRGDERYPEAKAASRPSSEHGLPLGAAIRRRELALMAARKLASLRLCSRRPILGGFPAPRGLVLDSLLSQRALALDGLYLSPLRFLCAHLSGFLCKPGSFARRLRLLLR